MEEFIYDVLNLDDWWWSVGRRALVKSLARRYANRSDQQTVLDIGCGTGTNLKELAHYGSIYGSDISPAALRYCRDRGIHSVCLADAASLPYRDEQFDLIVSVDVLEHLDDDGAALREIYRVCKPRGVVIATVPAFQFLWSRRDEQHHHKRRYTLKQLRRGVTAAGFRVERATYINLPLLVPLFLMVKVGQLLSRSPSLKTDFVLVPPLLNKLLSWVVDREAHWLRHADLPFGTSIACVAVRPDDALPSGLLQEGEANPSRV